MGRASKVLAALAIVTAAPLASCDVQTGCGCSPDYSDYLHTLAQKAPIVVAAEVVISGSTGEVAIRPLQWLRGTLPLDEYGLFRFAWHQVEPPFVGVWLFEADGRPVWPEEARENSFQFEYPWHAVTIMEVFPEAVLVEAQRVLSDADVVLDLSTRPHEPQPSIVKVVLRGDGTLAVGDELTLVYSESKRPPNVLAEEGGVVWTLESVDGEWVTVPTWLPPYFVCRLPTYAAVEAAFPAYEFEADEYAHLYAGGCAEDVSD